MARRRNDPNSIIKILKSENPGNSDTRLRAGYSALLKLEGKTYQTFRDIVGTKPRQPNRDNRAFSPADTIIVGDQAVTCKGGERDKYKRLIAICFAGTKDLNAEMVRQGWALAYRKYSTAYVVEEASAKAQKLGLWRGQFVAPWDWRRGKRLASDVQKPCCKICRKGKACGNSCIRRTYTCRKPPGCACDAR